MAPKKKDLAAQKAARDKKILAGLSVVFVAVFVLLVLPKLTAKGPVATAATPGSTSTPTATTPVVNAPVVPSGPVVSSGALSSAGYSFTANSSQLKGLNGHLKSKDPFAGSPAVTTEAVTPPAAAALTTGTPDGGPGTANPGDPTATGPAATTPLPDPYIYARVSVNGVPEDVALNAPFPAAAPLFVLKAIRSTSIRFTLVNGNFANGATIVTLVKGHKLTLTNTADGSRFVVTFISSSRKVPEASTTTDATSTGVLVAPSTTQLPADTTSTPPPPTTPTITE